MIYLQLLDKLWLLCNYYMRIRYFYLVLAVVLAVGQADELNETINCINDYVQTYKNKIVPDL